MVKNLLKLTRIAAGVSFHGRRKIQLKYGAEDIVFKNKKLPMDLPWVCVLENHQCL
jgi:hypothetical protein